MRLYEQAVLLAGADIPVGTLQNWLQRGTIALDSPETGSERRGRRRYSERDVIRLALMADLVGRGINPATAGQIVNEQTMRPAGFLPEWMGRTRADYFLLIGDLENGSPLTTAKGQRLMTLTGLLGAIAGTDRKPTDVDQDVLGGVFLNLSAMTRRVRERILDALAADHIADQPGGATDGAPGDE